MSGRFALGCAGLTAASVLLAGCGGGDRPTGAGERPAASAPNADMPEHDAERRNDDDSEKRGGWRSIATAADRTRLREWRTAWTGALAQVPARDIAAERDLFDPDRVLDTAMPPAGRYRCRTYKLGARDGAGLHYVAYGWFSCRIAPVAGAADTLAFVKLGGSQRPAGTLYSGTATRGIFLGSMALGDERRSMRYGSDESRDMAGLVERIGDQRWRIVLPYPRFESLLDVIELEPEA